MSKLSRDDVLKLARLSRLKLSEDEVKQFQKELSAVLDYVEKLNQVNTDGLEPTYQVTGLKNITRKDEIKDYGASPKELLKNAPALKDAQLKVKKIL